MLKIMIIMAVAICVIKDLKMEKLKEELEIKKSENLALKRVLVENDLIPREYVK